MVGRTKKSRMALDQRAPPVSPIPNIALGTPKARTRNSSMTSCLNSKIARSNRSDSWGIDNSRKGCEGVSSLQSILQGSTGIDRLRWRRHCVLAKHGTLSEDLAWISPRGVFLLVRQTYGPERQQWRSFWPVELDLVQPPRGPSGGRSARAGWQGRMSRAAWNGSDRPGNAPEHTGPAFNRLWLKLRIKQTRLRRALCFTTA